MRRLYCLCYVQTLKRFEESDAHNNDSFLGEKFLELHAGEKCAKIAQICPNYFLKYAWNVINISLIIEDDELAILLLHFS